MPVDYELTGVIGALIKELRDTLGEKALELPSVRKAQMVIARKAIEDVQQFGKEVEARKIQEDLREKK